MTPAASIRIAPHDLKPATALTGEPLDRSMVTGGCVAVLVAHLGPLLIWGAWTALEALGFLPQPSPAPVIPPRQIVEARFVQLGKPAEEKLPQRNVPVKATAPAQPKPPAAKPPEPTPTPAPAVVPSATPREPAPTKPRTAPPPDATEDLLQRLGDRAHHFSEIAERQEKEGSPDGIPEGTEKDTAKAGDLYVGQLYTLFRRGWSVPGTISDAELRNLVAEVSIAIGTDLYIRNFSLTRPSGNPLFDQSVLDRIGEVQASRTKLPDPPREVASDFLGQTIGLRFLGRNAR